MVRRRVLRKIWVVRPGELGVLVQGRPMVSCHKIRAQSPLVDFATAVLQDSEFLTGEDASGASGSIELTVDRT